MEIESPSALIAGIVTERIQDPGDPAAVWVLVCRCGSDVGGPGEGSSARAEIGPWPQE